MKFAEAKAAMQAAEENMMGALVCFLAARKVEREASESDSHIYRKICRRAVNEQAQALEAAYKAFDAARTDFIKSES